MNNIIGFKGTAQERLFNWQAMIIWKRGWRDLKGDPTTKDIAEMDLKRYKRMLTSYVA